MDFLRTVARFSTDSPGIVMQYLTCGHRHDLTGRTEPEPQGTQYHCKECETGLTPWHVEQAFARLTFGPG